jgi:hypothetical protein
MTAAAEQDIEVSQARKVFMGVIHYGLLSFAMYASFLHWFALVRHDGQGKLEAAFIAGCVDLVVYLATLYRQRDTRIGRKPMYGFCTFPNLVLVLAICGSAAGNVAEAKHSFGGYSVALIPTLTFLTALTLGERDLAETDRRNARKRLEAIARAEALEEDTRRRAEAERLRQEACAEEERLAAEREAKRLEGEERRRLADAQRLAGAAPSRPGTVSATVSPGIAGVVPPPEARANSTDRIKMWAAWVHAIKHERKILSGAELLRAAGCSPESSLGRRMAANWSEIEPAKSLIASLGQEASG